ncbi:hypothetical protein BOH78_5049 [Pichia kudriavzevii]|uniref:Uncharacterized protein n=1 Tax=Pichia kudriavzevii TaxID=4909 RepID=A0A1V2LHR4_PICKU|nr:hypothetical protein BOH78_5049 [Pichia kudriavzevii]
MALEDSYKRDKQFPKVPPRTIAEARSRLARINPRSSIPYSLFLEILEDLQKTLWDNAKAIDNDNKLRNEVSKAAG